MVVTRIEPRVLLERARESVPGRCVRIFADLNGLDRAMVLASQAFTALIPLLILVSAALPAGNTTVVSDAVIHRFALSGEAANAVEAVFAHPDTGTVGLASLLLLVFSGVSLTRRMQQMYVRAWRLPPLRGVRGSLNAAMGLTVLLVEVSLLYLVRTLVRGLPFDWALQLPLSWAAGIVLWTTIPWLLMDRRVPWRRLLPCGVLTAIMASVYGVVTTLYMPSLMTSYSERYGLFGVTVAIVGWLLCTMFILVAVTVVAAELDRAPERWARRLRRAVDHPNKAAAPISVRPREPGGP
ncbi:MAG TPA: YhjD/YihY/BrkB family envelope integrity protein [Dermatophilaceae bacterium]|nr:YhjD/YihY/BrkB family envelope integrity protein [Dermatophilaceae bacterium]